MGSAASVAAHTTPIQRVLERQVRDCEASGQIQDRESISLAELLGSNIPSILSHEIDFMHVPTLFLMDRRKQGAFSWDDLCALVGMYEAHRDALLAQTAHRRHRRNTSDAQATVDASGVSSGRGTWRTRAAVAASRQAEDGELGRNAGSSGVGSGSAGQEPPLGGGSVTDIVRAFCLLCMVLKLREDPALARTFPSWIMRLCSRAAANVKNATTSVDSSILKLSTPAALEAINNNSRRGKTIKSHKKKDKDKGEHLDHAAATSSSPRLNRRAARLLFQLLSGGAGSGASSTNCFGGLSFPDFFQHAVIASRAHPSGTQEDKTSPAELSGLSVGRDDTISPAVIEVLMAGYLRTLDTQLYFSGAAVLTLGSSPKLTQLLGSFEKYTVQSSSSKPPRPGVNTLSLDAILKEKAAAQIARQSQHLHSTDSRQARPRGSHLPPRHRSIGDSKINASESKTMDRRLGKPYARRPNVQEHKLQPIETKHDVQASRSRPDGGVGPPPGRGLQPLHHQGNLHCHTQPDASGSSALSLVTGLNLSGIAGMSDNRAGGAAPDLGRTLVPDGVSAQSTLHRSSLSLSLSLPGLGASSVGLRPAPDVNLSLSLGAPTPSAGVDDTFYAGFSDDDDDDDDDDAADGNGDSDHNEISVGEVSESADEKGDRTVVVAEHPIHVGDSGGVPSPLVHYRNPEAQRFSFQ